MIRPGLRSFVLLALLLATASARADTIYVADEGSGLIRKFNSSGQGSVFTAVQSPTGLAFDSAGNLYASSFFGDKVTRFNSVGQPTLIINSGMYEPVGLAFDTNGNLFVANSYSDSGYILKITPGGQQSTFAS